MRFIPVVKKYSWNVSPEKASLIGTIGGAAIGGLTGGLAGKLVDKKLNKNKADKGSWLNRNKGALTGAALGAIGGGFGGREIARRQWIKSNLGEFGDFSGLEKDPDYVKFTTDPQFKEANDMLNNTKSQVANSIIERHDDFHNKLNEALEKIKGRSKK